MMKIADTTNEPGPADHFKVEHVAQANKKVVPEKINQTVHCKDEDLINTTALRKAHQRNMKYSEKVIVFSTGPDTRLFDNIIKKGATEEQNRIERERVLA